MTDAGSADVRCPRCGSAIRPEWDRCWPCAFGPDDAVQASGGPPPPQPPPPLETPPEMHGAPAPPPSRAPLTADARPRALTNLAVGAALVAVLTVGVVAYVSRSGPAVTVGAPAPTTTALPTADGGTATTTTFDPTQTSTADGSDATTPASGAPVLASSTEPGVAVSPDEAHAVASQLWQLRMTARYQRDVATLRLIETGPALEADEGYVCNMGCRGPLLTPLSTTVNVPPQTTWPVDFFATVPFELPDCPVMPCDTSFVAVQTSPGAPWMIALTVDYSGTASAAQPVVDARGFAAPPVAEPSRQFQNLPAEYAVYLQSLKDTGRPPTLTRIGPGAFTSDLASKMYNPPLAQEAAGQLDTVRYFVAPTDPVWMFAGQDGVEATCGTVRFEDTARPLPGQQLEQPDDSSVYGSLAPGTYASIVTRGLHTVCLEASRDAAEAVAVFGTWGDVTGVSGVPAPPSSTTPPI